LFFFINSINNYANIQILIPSMTIFQMSSASHDNIFSVEFEKYIYKKKHKKNEHIGPLFYYMHSSY